MAVESEKVKVSTGAVGAQSGEEQSLLQGIRKAS